MSGTARRLETAGARIDSNSVDRGLLDSLLGHAIARANMLADATFQAAIQDRSITPLRYSLLELVASNPGLQQVQLAEALDLSRSAVTLLIDYWQARSCLERRHGASDRRSFGIFPTREGEALLADLRRRAVIHDRMLTASLDEGERVLLRQLLEKLHGIGQEKCY